MKDKNEVHLSCSCHGHGLHIESDPFCEEAEYKITGTYSFQWFASVWFRGYHGKSNWGFRLRTIWNVLKTGRPYGDEVILDHAALVELHAYTEEQLKRVQDILNKQPLP